jgi:signal transduction histidine kinase
VSLRLRLVLLIIALVTLVTVALSGLYLDSLVNSLWAAAFERSELASQQVNAFIVDHINQHVQEYETPTSVEQTKALWRDIVLNDRDISNTLERTMALSPSIVEINVAGQSGEILASSNPSRAGTMLTPLTNFSEWRSRPFYRRVPDLMARRADYQVAVPLGIAGQSEPVFIIQVVASSVLLRNTLLPEIQTMAAFSGGALLVSLLLTALFANRVLRPVRRIEQTIDRIAQGSTVDEPEASMLPHQPKEFAALYSKLDLLGQKFRGARQDASKLKQSLDEMVERMASQLDVATRLAAISRISGGVAHEIKNPLNAIALRLDLLRARVMAGAPEEGLTPEIDVLSSEVRRLDRVVKTFLDFSRPVDVRLTEVDLAALAKDVTILMTPQARVAGIEMSYQEPGGPATMRGDADLLKQAILNLVINATEAMKNGGHLRVSVSHEGETVSIEVADDGPGIPPDVREKVFQLYFTTKERGSGIGLAMTYRAVQLHNGTVDFVSDSGGTTFRLQFPASVHHG